MSETNHSPQGDLPIEKYPGEVVDAESETTLEGTTEVSSGEERVRDLGAWTIIGSVSTPSSACSPKGYPGEEYIPGGRRYT